MNSVDHGVARRPGKYPSVEIGRAYDSSNRFHRAVAHTLVGFPFQNSKRRRIEPADSINAFDQLTPVDTLFPIPSASPTPRQESSQRIMSDKLAAAFNEQSEQVKPSALDDQNDDLSDDDDSLGGDSRGSGVVTDALSRLRRQKRLAMNRESARARRKRKKALIETLEEHVNELTKRNQRYQMATESLTAKVNKLESDLAISRSTIQLLTSQGRPDQQQLVMPSLQSADLGLGPGGNAEIRRLIQAQAMQQSQMGGGAAGFGGPSGFMDDPRLRRQALDMQALQAHDPGALGLGRFGQQGGANLNFGTSAPPGLLPTSGFNTVRADEASHWSCASFAWSFFPRLCSNVRILLLYHQVATSQELPGELRLGMQEMSPGMHGVGMMDALSPTQSRSAATSQMLREYLKQGEPAGGATGKFQKEEQKQQPR